MKVVIAQQKPGPFDAVRQVVLGLGLECGAEDCVLFADLSARLSPRPVDLVLVRASGEKPADAEAVGEVIREAISLTRAPVLAIGPVNDARHILEVTRSGAREYLDESRLREELERFLGQLSAADEGSSGGHAGTFGSGSVFSVVSPVPGAGVTTLATNLAFVWGRKESDSVVLAELGRDPADVAGRLDVKPLHGVAELCNSGERLDRVLLHQALAAHAGGVSILAHMPETMLPAPVEAGAMRRLLVLFRTLFATAVLDLGHTADEEQFEAMRLSDLVLVVARLDVPALRQVRRFLRVLAEQGIARERIRLVANYYGQPGQVAWRDAEDALGVRFLEYVAEDSRKANQALNNGQPVVNYAASARMSRQIVKLAGLLMEQRPARTTAGSGRSVAINAAANGDFLPPEVPVERSLLRSVHDRLTE